MTEYLRKKMAEAGQTLPAWAYKSLLGELHEGVVIVAIDNSSRAMNQAAAAIYGYANPEQFEKHLDSLPSLFVLRTYPQGRRLAEKDWPIRQLQSGKASITCTLLVTRLDSGIERVIEYNGKRISDTYVLLSLRDVTAEKQYEKERAEEHSRQAAFFTSALDAILIVDDKSIIREFNPAAERIFGYSHKEAVGNGMAELIIPMIHRKNHRKGMATYVATGNGPIMDKLIEITAIRKDGNEFPVELFITRIGNGSPTMFMGTIRDITDRKLTEQATQNRIQELRQRQELEKKALLLAEQREQLLALNNAKDEFIAIASHQLRTPATGVKQYVGMLLQGYFGEPTEEQMPMLRAAYNSNERQLAIINALLNVARLDSGKVALNPIACNLSHFIEEIAREQTEVLRIRKQTLTIHTPRAPVIAHVDTQLLRMVVENLIDNAGKYSKDGRTIEIHVTHTATNVSIAIRDHGVGISKKDQSKLFQKFSRIDNELSSTASGSGLGLYWAKKIVDLHQGRIDIASKAKQGAVFTITMPKTTSYL